MERKYYVQKATGAVLYKLAIYLVNEGTEREDIMSTINKVVSSAIAEAPGRARAYGNRHEIGRVSLANTNVSPSSAHRFLSELFQECCVHRVFGDAIYSIFAEEHVRRIHHILGNSRGTRDLQKEFERLEVFAIVFP